MRRPGRRFYRPATDSFIDTPGVWRNISPGSLPFAFGIATSPAAPQTLYVNANSEFGVDLPLLNGIYKSTNRGNSWSGPIGSTWYDQDGTTILTSSNAWSQGVSWTIAVDQTDANIVYAFVAFAGIQGPYKSTDGGVTWRYLLTSTQVSQMSADIYQITIDPLDHLHVLMTFHSGWGGFGGDSGVAESLDGGSTWIQHAPTSGWGTGHYAFFLGQDDSGTPSSTYWILATQGDGFWRTTNSGTSWTQVDGSHNMQHGAGALYRASDGALYMGAEGVLLRSPPSGGTSNGRGWAAAGNIPTGVDGYNAIIGDGTTLFTRLANTNDDNIPDSPYVISSETDGLTWSTMPGGQNFQDGPGWMACDRVSKIIYSANWNRGLWRLVTGN